MCDAATSEVGLVLEVVCDKHDKGGPLAGPGQSLMFSIGLMSTSRVPRSNGERLAVFRHLGPRFLRLKRSSESLSMIKHQGSSSAEPHGSCEWG